jgi:hypothetical protein
VKGYHFEFSEDGRRPLRRYNTETGQWERICARPDTCDGDHAYQRADTCDGSWGATHADILFLPEVGES